MLFAACRPRRRAGLALVRSELEPETLLCIRDPLHGVQWDLEFAIAKRADPNGRNGPQPFGDPQIALQRIQDSQKISEGKRTCDTRHTVDCKMRGGENRVTA